MSKIGWLSKEQIAAGHRRFLNENPPAKAKVEAITPKIADHLGMDLIELQYQKTHRLLTKHATELGLDTFEYLLNLSIEDPAERQQILQARKDAVEVALGLRWPE